MHATATSNPSFIDALIQHQACLNLTNVAWLRKLREEALAQFHQLGFPTLRHEAWKYTSVAALTNIAFKPSIPNPSIELNNYPLTTLTTTTLVFVDGFWVPQLSHLPALANGIKLTSLTTLLQEQPELLKSYLTRDTFDQSSFGALNTAFMQDGAVFILPDDTILEAPIHLLYITTSQASPTVSHLRNVMVVGKNSQATIIESYLGEASTTYLTNTITSLHIEKGGQVAHCKLLLESEKAFHIGSLNVTQQAHSQCTAHSFVLNGGLVRSDTEVDLLGEYANCTLNGLYLAQGRQHIDHHTRITHKQPHGTSCEYYKGVLAEQSRAVFNGKVQVQLNAQKTDTRQTNANLLLSNQAEIDTKPELEIYANDVKCTHGATIGQLNEDLVFYLCSRGIGQTEARAILCYAFLSELIQQVNAPSLQTVLRQLVASRLPGADNALEDL